MRKIYISLFFWVIVSSISCYLGAQKQSPENDSGIIAPDIPTDFVKLFKIKQDQNRDQIVYVPKKFTEYLFKNSTEEIKNALCGLNDHIKGTLRQGNYNDFTNYSPGGTFRGPDGPLQKIKIVYHLDKKNASNQLIFYVLNNDSDPTAENTLLKIEFPIPPNATLELIEPQKLSFSSLLGWLRNWRNKGN